MTTTQRPPDELGALIAASFGDGPEHRPVERQLAAGRGALRRRRLASAVAGLAVLTVVGTTYSLTGDDRARTHGRVASEPSSSPSATVRPTGEPWEVGQLVRAVDGELEVHPDAQVHQRISDPAGPGSLAVDLTFRGSRSWIVALVGDDGFSSSGTVPVEGTTFREWAIAAGAEMLPESPPDTPLLRLSPDGQVEAAPGVRILQRTDDPRLGESFAPPGVPTGAALLRPADSDDTWFVEWRVVDGELDVVPLSTRDLVGATFEELLSYARAQNASGEGLR